MTVADDDRARRFDTLFKERSPDVIAYCRWRARSQSDAQDAVAEVFLTAWRRLDDVPRLSARPGARRVSGGTPLTGTRLEFSVS